MEEVLGLGCGGAGLHMEGWIPTPRDWLTLQGVVPLGSARPWVSQHQNTENKSHV